MQSDLNPPVNLFSLLHVKGTTLRTDPSPSSTFPHPIFFIRPFHASLGPLRSGTRAAELGLHLVTQTDSHLHSDWRTHRHTRTCMCTCTCHLSKCSYITPINFSSLAFFLKKKKSGTLRVRTNANLETQKIRHLNAD